jgi:hypothetical protein
MTMQFWDITTVITHLSEDLADLKSYGVKRLGFDPLALMKGHPLVLVEFHDNQHSEDIRRLMNVTDMLKQTLGPNVSVKPFPSSEIPSEALAKTDWFEQD